MRFIILLFLPFLVQGAWRATNNVNTYAGNITYNEDWGYTTVRTGAHSFWWLYSAAQTSNDRPLFLWLQGGPGSSGVGFGNFEETGPKDLNENDNPATWLQKGDLVYVDNPVGTGFSYVDNVNAYTTDVAQIGQDLLTWMIDFLKQHPEYKTRPFFIVCESYGGKMTAEFAKTLYQAIQSGVVSMTAFKGIGLGDSWISPMDFVNTWGPYLYAQSYLDDQQLAQVNKQALKCQSLVNRSQWSDATDCWSETESLIGFVTGGVSWYNVLKESDQDDWSMKKTQIAPMRSAIKKLYKTHVAPFHGDKMNDYMNTVARKKLGIIPDSVKFGGQSSWVFDYQSADFMKPNWDTVDLLLNYGLQVTVFNGQLDLICDTMGSEKWVNRLKWSGLTKWQQVDKQPFETKNFPLAGYTKTYKNLQFIWILRAGHMVAYDTPESGLFVLQEMIDKSK